MRGEQVFGPNRNEGQSGVWRVDMRGEDSGDDGAGRREQGNHGRRRRSRS